MTIFTPIVHFEAFMTLLGWLGLYENICFIVGVLLILFISKIGIVQDS